MPNGPNRQMGPPQNAGMENPQTDGSDEESPETESKSCLIDKSLFNEDPKVGDTIMVKIEAIYEDEVEVSIASNDAEPKTKAYPTFEEDLEEESASSGMA